MNKGIVKYIHILFSSIFFIFIFDHSANGCDTIKINAFLDSVFIHVESLKKEQNTDSVIFVLSLSLGVIENEKCLHHFRVNELYQQLAYAYQLKLNFEKAEHNYLKSIETLKLYVKEHDMALARCYNLLGNLYVDMGLYYKSDSVYHVVKSMYSKSLGKDHLWMGWIYHNIGRLRIYQGKLRESLPDLNEALRIKIVNVGQDDIDAAGTMVYLGYVYEQLGDVRTAEYYSSKSSEIWISHYGSGSLYHAYAAHNLININLSLGNYKKAEELANTAVELKLKYLGSHHSSLATTYNAMGNIFQVQQNYQTAIENYRKAEQIFLYLKDTANVEFVFVNHNLGVCYLGIKNFELAGFYLKKSLHLKYLANGDENMDYVSTLIHLAEWMVFQNNFAEAEKYMLTAKKYMENNRIDINDNYLLLLALFEKKGLV
ncbi:MAG: tetratricopeptide repeat protein [Saprospiraceae bacterium]|nr:tetratricopeptide repeat protein [Saprospiraceae bacterium]